MTHTFFLYRGGITICLLAILALVLMAGGCTQPSSQQQQQTTAAPAPVTATQTDGTHILITYTGSSGTSDLLELETTITDSTGKQQTKSLGDRFSTTPLKFGATLTLSGTFNDKDHVLVTGYFMDSSHKSMLDTTI